MEMSWLSQVCNLEPLVLGYLIDFTLLWYFIWIFWTNCIKVVLSLILKSLVQMSKLMSRSTKVHWCLLLNFRCVFIDDKCIICYNRSDFILFLFSTYAEDFIMYLDWDKFFWQNIWISQVDWCCGLRSQLMDQQSRVLSIIVVKSWLLLGEDKVWFKADDIFEEASEFVKFTSDNYIWPWIFLKISHMWGDSLHEVLCSRLVIFNLWTKFKYLKEVPLISQLLHLCYVWLLFLNECIHWGESVLWEVFWRWFVLLNTL